MDRTFALLLDRFPSEISILGDPKQGPSTMNVNEGFPEYSSVFDTLI